MDIFTSHLAEHRNTVSGFVKLGRMSEWWEYKFVPALLIGYVTSLYLGESPWTAATGLAMLLLALFPGGVFVSVLNDLTDRADDHAAGKPNRQEGRHRGIPIALLFFSLLAGAAIIWSWRNEPPLVTVYVLGWAAFALYSLPPFRLKSRGLPGVLCDATGAHLVPALLAAFLVAHSLGRDLTLFWVCAVGSWSLLYGLRGILWHQLGDLDADRLSKTETFVARYGKAVTMRVVIWVFFPLEVAALLVVIFLSGFGSMLTAILALALYARLEYRRIDQFDMTVTIVDPKPRSSIALREYYDVMLPLGFLLFGVAREWETVAVLALHCVLFPLRLRQVVTDFIKFSDPQYLSRSQRYDDLT